MHAETTALLLLLLLLLLLECCCRLVGVARVPKVDDAFLSTFLMLPTDALAVMKAQLEFS
jgi:hypothetical protein